ncbi:condensation domain-containing protein [Nonomuraea sp. NPDC050328]|uniref:condensation domain-containing protein n=1 Tax=Nonomuraea sp. NPDC050328 TaxID=3364361 RepID=UPI00379D322F
MPRIVEDLCGLFREILPDAAIGADTDFFEAGGNSLAAARLAGLIRSRLGTPVSLVHILEYPSPEGLASVLAELSAEGALDAEPDVPSRSQVTSGIVSIAQEHRFDIWRQHPTSRNLCRMQLLRGPLERTALTRAARRLLARHQALRSAFDVPPAGVPHVAVRDVGDAFDIDWYDLRALPYAAARRYVETAVDAACALPFEFSAPPFLRIVCAHLAEETFAIALVVEHLVADGMALDILLADLAALYGGEVTGADAGLPELPYEFLDFARWQRTRLAGHRRQELLDYWGAQIRDRGLYEGVAFPQWRKTEGLPLATKARAVVPLSELTDSLHLGRRHGLTPYMVAITAFAAATARAASLDSVPIVSVTGNRPMGAERVVGWFAHAFSFEVRVRADGLASLFEGTRAAILDASRHEELPYFLVLKLLKPDMGRNGPNVFFSYQSDSGPVSWHGMDAEELDDLPATAVPFGGLAVDIIEARGNAVIELTFGSENWPPETMASLLGDFVSFLKDPMLLEQFVAERNSPEARSLPC